MISGRRRRDELEAHQIAVRPRLRPNHLRVLDRLVFGRRPNPQRANVIHGDIDIDRDAEPANACVDRQAGTSGWFDQIDLGIERPAAELTPCAAMHGEVCATLRKNRSQPVENGIQGRLNLVKRGVFDQCFPMLSLRKNDRVPTLRGEAPHAFVNSRTKTDRTQSIDTRAEPFDRPRDARAVPK